MTSKEEIQQQHISMVQQLVKSPFEIANTLTDEKINLMHATFGICGEAGELLDAVKKHVIYNKPFDFENAKEELGDIEFYLEQFRQVIGISREETLYFNMAKLAERYPNYQYTDKRAHDRADKLVGN